MPDQPSQSLVDALLGYFRDKGQAMAAMTPGDQWRQFGQTAPLALLGIRHPGAYEQMRIAGLPPKEWDPRFIGPQRKPYVPWTERQPAAPPEAQPPRSAMDEMIARAEETSKRRQGQ